MKKGERIKHRINGKKGRMLKGMNNGKKGGETKRD
jgi:hypothetical protein